MLTDVCLGIIYCKKRVVGYPDYGPVLLFLWDKTVQVYQNSAYVTSMIRVKYAGTTFLGWLWPIIIEQLLYNRIECIPHVLLKSLRIYLQTVIL